MRRPDQRLAECRAQNDQLRGELAKSRADADYWERTAVKVRAQLEATREQHAEQVASMNDTIRELVRTIARYPDSLADILNPRVEVKPPIGMDSIGFDDALGQPVGMYPAFEEDVDPGTNGRGAITEQDEQAW